MSFNKITFSNKEFSGKTFKKINFCFSNEDNFDMILHKNNGKTNLIFERSYIKNMIKYSFMNGGGELSETGMMDMVLPIIESMFLPVIGIYNMNEFKFDEIFAGSIKKNLSSKISSNMANSFFNKSEKVNSKSIVEEDNIPNQNIFTSMFRNLGQVWEKDYDEIQEEEEGLDDFLIENNNTTTTAPIKELVSFDNIIDKNLILFNFELKITDYEDLIKKISEKNPQEIFDLGKINLVEDFSKGNINGIERVEIFGENDSCVKIVVMHDNKEKEYIYNVEDVIQIKEFIFKMINYIKEDNYILQ